MASIISAHFMNGYEMCHSLITVLYHVDMTKKDLIGTVWTRCHTIWCLGKKKEESLLWRVHNFNCCLFFICWKGFSVTLILHSYLKFGFFYRQANCILNRLNSAKLNAWVLFCLVKPQWHKINCSDDLNTAMNMCELQCVLYF